MIFFISFTSHTAAADEKSLFLKIYRPKHLTTKFPVAPGLCNEILELGNTVLMASYTSFGS